MTTPASQLDETDRTDTDSTESQESSDAPSDASDPDEYVYGCPYCPKTYSDERLTRVHVTQADDEAHENQNGLMPETQIEVQDADETVVERRSRHPKEIDLSTIDIDAFPEELSDERRHVLVVASQHPEVDNRRELHRMVNEQLADDDSDVEPGYWTVRHAIDDFYHPSESDDTTTTESQTLGDLPLKKRAIIIARVVKPDATKSELSDIADCASSYPGTVLKEERHVLRSLKERLEDGETPTEIIRDELTGDALEEMLGECRMAELSLDLEALVAEMKPAESSSPETDDEVSTNQDAEVAPTGSQWGSPTDEHGVMGAAPPNPFGGASDDDSSGENGTQRTLADADGTEQSNATQDASSSTENTESTEQSSEDPDNSSESSEIGSGSGETVEISSLVGEYDSDVIAEIQLLRRKVTFLRRALSQGSQPGNQTAYLLSCVELIEQECEAILQAYNQG